MSVNTSYSCPNCRAILVIVDIPVAFDLCQCTECRNIFKVSETGDLTVVTKFFERLAMGDDRANAALSEEHQVQAGSINDTIRQWRASSEMDVLAMMGQVGQRCEILNNRLHSIKKRLAESLLGEPTPLDTKEMLRLVDECIDLASTSSAKRERGVMPTATDKAV